VITKQTDDNKSRKKDISADDYCVVLNMDNDKCYIDYCRVPEREQRKLLVK